MTPWVETPRFVETGRLLLFPERDAETVRANVEMNRKLGVVVSALTPSEISEIIPQACTDGVDLAVYEPNAGHADPVATTYAYAERARAHGAGVLTGCEVTGIRVSGGRVVGVETRDGLIEADAVVAATGPWVNGLAAPLGEILPVTPVRVQMVHMRRPPALESLTIAVADGITGGYIRAGEGFNTLVGGEAPEDFSEVSDPDDFSMTADHETVARFWNRAKLRFPDFAAATPLGGYAALYDMTPGRKPGAGCIRGGRGPLLGGRVQRARIQAVTGGRTHGGRARAARRERSAPDSPLSAWAVSQTASILRPNTPTRIGCTPDGGPCPGTLLVRLVQPEHDVGALFLEHRSDGAVPFPPAPVHRLGQLCRAKLNDPGRHPVLGGKGCRQSIVL